MFGVRVEFEISTEGVLAKTISKIFLAGDGARGGIETRGGARK